MHPAYARKILSIASPGIETHLDSLTEDQIVREAQAVIEDSLERLVSPRLDAEKPCRCKRCGCGIDQSQRLDSNGYQPSCPYCVFKHLSAAAAWIREANRYPERAFEAAGELDLASRECARSWPIVSDQIEQARIRLTNDDVLPTQEDFYQWLEGVGMMVRSLKFGGENGETYPCDYNLSDTLV